MPPLKALPPETRDLLRQRHRVVFVQDGPHGSRKEERPAAPAKLPPAPPGTYRVEVRCAGCQRAGRRPSLLAVTQRWDDGSWMLVRPDTECAWHGQARLGQSFAYHTGKTPWVTEHQIGRVHCRTCRTGNQQQRRRLPVGLRQLFAMAEQARAHGDTALIV